VLYIDDLLRAYELAYQFQDQCAGKAYNLGGGSSNAVSLIELIQYINEHSAYKLKYSLSDWRPGDQKVFVCDINKAKKDFGWQPQVDVSTGIDKLLHWINQNRQLFEIEPAHN
jgi:CDP-paratose 2-epimerase